MKKTILILISITFMPYMVMAQGINYDDYINKIVKSIVNDINNNNDVINSLSAFGDQYKDKKISDQDFLMLTTVAIQIGLLTNQELYNKTKNVEYKIWVDKYIEYKNISFNKNAIMTEKDIKLINYLYECAEKTFKDYKHLIK